MIRCKRCSKEYNIKKSPYCPYCGAVGEQEFYDDNTNYNKTITVINKKHKKSISRIVAFVIWLGLVALLIILSATLRIEENRDKERKSSSRQIEYREYYKYYENLKPEDL